MLIKLGAAVRELTRSRAFWAGLFGFGYVYVGRIGMAFALITAALAPVAMFSWARWILEPWALYTLLGTLLALLVLGIAHPIVIVGRKPTVPRKRYNRWWFYVGWLIVVGIVLNTVFGNRAMVFGYEMYRIPAGSMAPTLHEEDFIVVDTWRYRDEQPRVGDVIVYEENSRPGQMYVARVVGIPGDQIEIREGRLFRNDQRALEEYLDPSLRVGGIDFEPIVLGADEYFVLGDNRGNSRDSRYHGPVAIERIAGRVESIWFSMADFGRFPTRVEGGT